MPGRPHLPTENGSTEANGMSYCSTLTTAQVRGVLEKELRGGRKGGELYHEAREELARRGEDADAVEAELAVPEETDDDTDDDTADDAVPSLRGADGYEPTDWRQRYADIRAQLQAMADARGLSLVVVGRMAEREGWKKDDGAAHVRVSLFCKTADGQIRTPGGPLEITYSAGSAIVARWARELPYKSPECGRIRSALFRRGLGQVSRLFAEGREVREALIEAAKHYVPDVLDVLGCLLMDASSFTAWGPAGPTFREWLQEGTAPENAADALDCYEEIGRTWRWLSRVFGDELDRACELAGEL